MGQSVVDFVVESLILSHVGYLLMQPYRASSFPVTLMTSCGNLIKSFQYSFLQGVVQLAIALSEETEEHIQAATAWALGQIGRHTPEHAKAIAQANVLPRLLELYLSAEGAEDLQTKVSIALWFVA